MQMSIINGAVNSPIVLRGYTEQSIAQQAHNIVWTKHMAEWLPLHDELKRRRKTEEPTEEIELRRNQMRAEILEEINKSVIAEISEYRAANHSSQCAPIEELTARIDELESLIDSAQSEAEDAQSLADEAQSRIEELEARIAALESRPDDDS